MWRNDKQPKFIDGQFNNVLRITCNKKQDSRKYMAIWESHGKRTEAPQRLLKLTF